jgi:hypothetical protein
MRNDVEVGFRGGGVEVLCCAVLVCRRSREIMLSPLLHLTFSAADLVGGSCDGDDAKECVGACGAEWRASVTNCLVAEARGRM